MRKHNKRLTSILLATFCSLVSGASLASAATVASSNLVDIPTGELQALVSTAYGNSALYSGLRFDEMRHTYILGAVDAKAATKELKQLFHGSSTNESSLVANSSVRVKVMKQSTSRNALNSVMSQVTADVKSKNLADGRVTAWYIDEDANRVVIEIVDKSAKDVLELHDRYGSRLVSVIPGKRATTAEKVTTSKKPITLQKVSKSSIAALSLAKSPSRLLDVPSYNSAVRIFRVDSTGTTIYQCTTAMNRKSLTQAVTAGHCAPLGATIYQGYVDEASSTAYYSDILGTVTLSILGNGNPDFANIGASVSLSGVQYTSDAFNLEEYVATDQTSESIKFVVGQSVCTNGSFSGYSCHGATVKAVNTCINAEGISLICGLDRASSSDGSAIVQHGDSGGPMLTGSLSAGAQVGGVISASEAGGTTVYASEASRT